MDETQTTGAGAPRFEKVDTAYRFAQMEEALLEFWEREGIFARTLAKPAPRGSWVFYEGPPTANNMPHPGHVLTRVVKDCLPRFKTMQGYYVRRQAGWDTHGLPVELSVEAELAAKGELNGRGPTAIREYGLEKFNRACFESVRRYEQEWVKLSNRVGFWLDYDKAYFTFTNQYIESVWWLLKQIWDKGLIYRGYRIQWYSTLIGTGLSDAEVAQNWQTVKDPSATVRARFVPGQDLAGYKTWEHSYLLLWTTTPWTLLSNVGLCVNPDYDYVAVEFHNEAAGRTEHLILAEALLEKNGLDAESIAYRWKGRDLLGAQYERLFDYDVPDISGRAPVPGRSEDGAQGRAPSQGWRVVGDEYVTLEDGTGVVHLAPAFGEDDYRIGQRENLPVLNAIDAEGRALASVLLAPGKWFKEVDPEVLKDLKARGLLFKSEKYEHNYPHCYRTDAPLMMYPLESWFIKMSDPAVKEKLLSGNEQIRWQPAHVKQGRFGDWLGNVKDWSLSRDRFWGTPFPVWQCEACGEQEFIGSYTELAQRCPERFAQVSDVYDQSQFNPHRPYIDDYAWPCGCGGTKRRLRYVIDCWFDAGSMPFAQLHYPFENKEMVDGPEEGQGPRAKGQGEGEQEKQPSSGGSLAADSDADRTVAATGTVAQFPADFISEAIDQTRGWFYTLHAISTLVKEQPAYKSCLVMGHILDEKGRKMSKRLGNVVDPWKVINAYGADAFRWYFYSGGSLTTGARFSEKGVLESLQRFAIPLWNAYSFFTIYANIDGFDPVRVLRGEGLAWEKLPELDKWILIKLSRLSTTCAESLDALDLTSAARAIEAFTDELTNWYIRRSRRRFWQGGQDEGKQAAYETLYSVLTTLARISAPFVPFMAEELHQKLVVRFGEGGPPCPPSEGAQGRAPSHPNSVHLCDYPVANPQHQDDALEQAMDQTLRAATLGHSARKESRLRVRQPLRKVVLVTREPGVREAIESHREILLEELNVKGIEFAVDESLYVSYEFRPNFRELGPRLGERGKLAAAWLRENGAEAARQLEAHRENPISVLVEDESGEADLSQTRWLNWVEAELDGEKVVLDERCFEVLLRAKDESVAERDGGLLLVLDTHVDEALRLEGFAREIVSRLQTRRKELDLDYSARIRVGYSAPPELEAALSAHRQYIMDETLASALEPDAALDSGNGGPLRFDALETEIDGLALRYTVEAV